MLIDTKISKKHIYEALVHNKKKGGLGYRAKFTFKWIPALDFHTPRSLTLADRTKDSGAFKHVGPEALSLVTLVITITCGINGMLGVARMATNGVSF